MTVGKRVDRFVDFIHTRKLIDESNIRRAVSQYKSFDRRFGQLASFLGYIQPEKVNAILHEQAQNGGMFGHCAMRLNLMEPEQVVRIASLQKDDLSIFAQAVGIQNAATSVEFTSVLTEFLRANPDASKEDAASSIDTANNVDEKIRNVLVYLESVSPLPGAVERVLAKLDDPEVNLDDVAQILKLDPGLTAMLLRVVNSAFYGLRSKIGSTKKALQILGTDKLRQLVIAAGIMQKFQALPEEFTYKFWENAMRTAECCKEIGKFCRIAELDELFVCGLLHNIGELVIKQFFVDHGNEIQNLVNEKKSLLEAEKQVLGGTHADIGGFLFHIWKLPRTTIQTTMFHHHDFEQLVHTPNIAEEVFIVHMASTLCGLDAGLGAAEYDKALDVIGKYYQTRLKFPPILDLGKLMERVDTTIEQLDKNYFK